MKKILTVIVSFLLCCVIHAQVYIGGSAGVERSHEYKSFNFSPEVGYCINEHNSVSLAVGVSANTEYSSFYIAPCYTYAIPFGNNWCFDINGTVGYEKYFEIPGSILGIYIGPQLEYALTDHWTIYGSFDMISVEYGLWNENNKLNSNIENISVNLFDSGLNFGFYYYF